MERQYYKVQTGENCPAEKVIASKRKCKDALDIWQLKHHNLDVNDTARPAGCYWKSDGDGFFNNVLDPSSTNRKAFGDRGGLCNVNGKNHKNVLYW